MYAETDFACAGLFILDIIVHQRQIRTRCKFALHVILGMQRVWGKDSICVASVPRDWFHGYVLDNERMM